jgi:acyl-CoA reductase-like NAD-dependent aldehyde dehydrogenase
MCRNAGQTCVSTNRLLVQESVHDAFVAKLKVELNESTGLVFRNNFSDFMLKIWRSERRY